MRFISALFICLSLAMVCPLQALAVPAITCHCFTERRYDPARPALADPYFLATTQNSFFAAVFAVDKKTIVVKKQAGAAATDLWVAYWLAARSGADPESLLQARKSKGSWRQVAAQGGGAAKATGDRFAAAVKAGATDDSLANIVVDELLKRHRIYGDGELTALRKAGAGNQELIIAAMLAARTRQPALALYQEVRSGARSWGALLDRARIDPGDIQREMDGLVRHS